MTTQTQDPLTTYRQAKQAVKLKREEIRYVDTDRPMRERNYFTRYRVMLGDTCLGFVEGVAYSYCREKTWAMYPAYDSEGQPTVTTTSYTYKRRADALQALCSFVLPRLA